MTTKMICFLLEEKISRGGETNIKKLFFLYKNFASEIKNMINLFQLIIPESRLLFFFINYIKLTINYIPIIIINI